MRKQVNLVHHDNIHRSEHDRVLQGLFFPLCHCEHHGLRVLTDAKFRWTDKIADVLDDQQIKIPQREPGHPGSHHHGIEMALSPKPRACVYDGDRRRSGAFELPFMPFEGLPRGRTAAATDEFIRQVEELARAERI